MWLLPCLSIRLKGNHVGINLRRQVFTHGQLYVALSRTTDVRNISILLSPDNLEEKIKNVVYPEVLPALHA